jgi:drug/metabolite transporter (DMT)-like permease
MKSNKSGASLGAGLVILSSFFYASYGIWTKLMGNFFGGYSASALRSVVVLLILVPAALILRKFEPLNLKKNWLYILGITAASFFVWGPLYYSILHAGVGIAITINYASLMIGLLFFGWLFNKEKFTREKWLSAIIGIAGLVLVFSPGSSNGHLEIIALFAAALSGISTSLMSIIIKFIPYNATQATVVSWVTSVFANFAMAWLFKETIPAFGFQAQWIYLVLFAVASIAASLMLNRGIKLIDAGVAGILGLLEIVFGVLFGVLFFSEKPTLIAIVGVALIIISASIPYVYAISKPNKKRPRHNS